MEIEVIVHAKTSYKGAQTAEQPDLKICNDERFPELVHIRIGTGKTVVLGRDLIDAIQCVTKSEER